MYYTDRCSADRVKDNVSKNRIFSNHLEMEMDGTISPRRSMKTLPSLKKKDFGCPHQRYVDKPFEVEESSIIPRHEPRIGDKPTSFLLRKNSLNASMQPCRPGEGKSVYNQIHKKTHYKAAQTMYVDAMRNDQLMTDRMKGRSTKLRN